MGANASCWQRRRKALSEVLGGSLVERGCRAVFVVKYTCADRSRDGRRVVQGADDVHAL